MDNSQNISPRTSLRVERQWGQLIGTNVRTYDANNQLVCFARAKAFKLKEEIHFYSNEDKSTVLFSTKARNIIDIAPTFDLIAPDGSVFGALKRQGLSSSFVQDHWDILDTSGAIIGTVTEDDAFLGVMRRFVDFASLFMPQKYSVKFGALEVAEIKQRKNPFTIKYTYDVDTASWEKYKLLLLAIPNLLALIEGRQG